jgi:hypothetical protein
MIPMLVGLGVTVVALVVQALAAELGVDAIEKAIVRRMVGTSIWRNGVATLVLIMTLMLGHLVQIAVWATAFVLAREFDSFAVAFYHSAVNYTTLGYGDLIMSKQWRLLGPHEAASGTLAFGWSTAVIVTIVMRLYRQRHRIEVRRKNRRRRPHETGERAMRVNS